MMKGKNLSAEEAIILWKKTGDPSPLQRVISEYSFSEPNKAVKNLSNLAEDDLSLEAFLNFLPRLLQNLCELPDPDMTLNNWERFSRAVFDKQSLFQLAGENVNVLRLFNRIFSSSQFLADILIRNPEYFDWLIEENMLAVRKNQHQLVEEFNAAIKIFKDPQRRLNALCRLRRRELLRIGARDLLELSAVEEITQELTDLADAVLNIALFEAEKRVLKQFGEPQIIINGRRKKCDFIIVAMGKLGARELNFSSDIDLIFVYEDEGETSGSGAKKITNHQYFTYLARELIKFLSEPGEEGKLYRCDLRLRPEGEAGPLVRSLESYANYFYSQARSWECIAYLKARLVAGSKKLGADFRRLVEEFIFQPKDPDNFKAEIFFLKERIDHEVQQQNLTHRDVKRGFGGIREIEFLVSTLQLLFALDFPELNTTSTFNAIRQLAQLRLFSAEEAALLLNAYSFLRQVEHRLQIVWEARTHLLPIEAKEGKKLAQRLGHTGTAAAEEFISQYREITTEVHEIFTRFFKPAIRKPSAIADSDLLLLLASDTPEEKLLPILQKYRFYELSSFKHLRRLFSGTQEIFISATAQKFLESLLPRILNVCSLLPQPDLAIRNFVNFVSATKAQTAFFEFISEQPEIIEILLRLFGSSDFFSQLLISHPEFFEPLIIYIKEFSASALLSPGIEFEKFFPPLDKKPLLPKLRLFKQFWTMLSATCDLSFAEKMPDIHLLLTNLAEFVLQKVFLYVKDNLYQKYSVPSSPLPETSDHKAETINLILFALGGFGGREISYFSDLDIVFVMINGGKTTGQQEIENKFFFAKFAEAIIQEMSALTPEGSLFNIDTRLRPEGASGELVCTIERLLHYYEREAQIWEWQSFLKARAVVGNISIGEGLRHQINVIIQRRIAGLCASELREHLLDMRQRLEQSVESLPRWAEADFKRGAGGLVDIEFIVQYLQLKNCSTHSELFIPNTLEALKKLAQLNLITASEAELLQQNFQFLRLLESRQRLLLGKSIDLFPAERQKLEQLAYALHPHISSPQELKKKFSAILHSNRQLFSKILSS